MAVAVAEQTETLRELKERKEEILKAIETEGDRLIQEFYKRARNKGTVTFRKIVEECRTLTFGDEPQKYRLRGRTHKGTQWDVLRSYRKTEEIKEIFIELVRLFHLYRSLKAL